MTEKTIRDLMEHLPDFFAPSRAAGVSAIVKFVISGSEGGEWDVVIENGKCLVSQGAIEAANLIFFAPGQDVLDIFYNRLDPMQAYLQGRLRLKGNFSLALRLFDLFDIDAEKLEQLKRD